MKNVSAFAMYNLKIKKVIYFDFALSRIIFIGLLFICISSCTEEKLREYTAELLYQARSETGNAALWHPDRKSVFWVDTEYNLLHEYIPSIDKCNSWKFTSTVGSVVPETAKTVILALSDRIIRFNTETDEKENIAFIDVENGHLRCNDGKCSPNGKLWIGTTSYNYEKGAGSAYCVHPDGKVDQMFKGLTAANGLVWSKNHQFMFHNDVSNKVVKRYRYDIKTEDVIHNGVAINIPNGTGIPEGIIIDQQDNLWIPQRGGFGVYCYNPYTGQLVAKVNVPTPNVTSCTFGGENLDTIFITTSRKGLTKEELEKYPLSGSIFTCQIAPIGTKPFYFGRQNF